VTKQPYEWDICMVVHNAMLYDSRVEREAKSLASAGWRVLVLALTRCGSTLPETENTHGYTLRRVTVPGWYEALALERFRLVHILLSMIVIIARGIRFLRRTDAGVYHGHDFSGLLQIALAGRLKDKVVYDSHELYFDTCGPGFDCSFTHRYLIPLFRPLEKPLARRTAAILTVNDSIADILVSKLDVERPVVIKNAAEIREMPSPVWKRNEGEIKTLVHTGAIKRNRQLKELVQAAAMLPETIHLVFLGDGPYWAALHEQVKALGLESRVKKLSTVAPSEVVPTISQFDAAAVLPTVTGGLNARLSLPNKLFEAIAAGLPVVAGPNVEIAGLVKTYDLGAVCDSSDPASIAYGIETVFDIRNYKRYKLHAEKARLEVNWGQEEKKLIDLYTKLLS
jgi:glycosyltransferase involved in cell wall biosynthesis